MNPELEALIRALEAVIQARGGDEAERLDANFQAKLEEVLGRRPGLSRARLMRAVDFAHRKWQHAREKKPPSMPPRA
jgi:hypothetical protein